MENIVIGIEGYVGTGKTSVCRKLLDKIPNSVLLHGGNIYRAITYGILKTGLINVKEDNNKLSSLNIKNIMDKLKLKIEIEDRESVVYIHDKKIEEKDLQSLETSIATSKISSYANNDKLYDFGRNIIEGLKQKYNVILSSRDIVNMYPKVDYHFLLVADIDERVRRKMNQYTRYLTILILLVQAPSYLLNLKMQAGPSLNASLDWTLFMFTSTIILAAGSMFILWLGERITDKGIGNGISLIIMIGIIARLPQSLFQELISRMTDKTGGLVMFLIELVVLLVVIAFAILLVQGTRKIPVQYAKKIVGNKQYGGARQYIPLKVNAANVMPIIFAQAIMFIPITLVGFSNVNDASGFVRALTDHTSFWYNLIFAVLIILFTYFYTAITINPTQMAEDMKRNNGFIPGIKPGKQTAEYIDVIMSRITLPGSFFLALVAIMPAFAGIFGVKAEFAQFFGGTSLLILVGVVLDTLQQVESHLLMRHYDGLLKSGRIKGRSGNVAAY